MAVTEGACRLGEWTVRVTVEDGLVLRVEFTDEEPYGKVPGPIAAYCRGERADMGELRSVALERPGRLAEIYLECHTIPYGHTTTYGAIARQVGTSARAVGQAMRRNPTPLVIPCHRVIAGDGSYGGFSPSVAIKRYLLKMEGCTPPNC
ncbi:Methylated-DNA--protein-cysteine methyltransferase [anaerobic digester metagenome]